MQRMRIFALAACLVLTAAAMPALAWSRDDLPTIATSAANGNAAWGIKITLPSASDLVVEVNLKGPQTDSTATAGAASTDAAGNPSFMFIFSGVSSPDRSIGLPVQSGVAPQGLHVRLTSPQNRGQPGTDEACTFLCLALETDGAAAGTYYYVVWLAGGSSGDVNVKANAGSATFNVGKAASAGDADFTNGNPDIQFQQNGVGAKVIKGASVPFHAGTSTYGVYYDLNLKIVCAYYCLLPVETVNSACGLAGTSCSTATVSMDGPGGHQSGSTFYTMFKSGAGDYTFNIDSKVDAYNAGISPFACFVVCAGALLLEDYSILSVASVDVPA